MRIELDRTVAWMNFLREHPEHRDRFLECFWPSQINSKYWLLEKLGEINITPVDITIFGGWYGILAQLIEAATGSYTKIVSVDIDPTCAEIGLKAGAKWTQFVTSDMATYEYPADPQVVINTSCEHVTQDVYDAWWYNIPKGTWFFLQGNDFFACKEHVRCSTDVEHFITQCNLGNATKIRYGTMDCPGPFTRFMVWGKKTA